MADKHTLKNEAPDNMYYIKVKKDDVNILDNILTTFLDLKVQYNDDKEGTFFYFKKDSWEQYEKLALQYIEDQRLTDDILDTNIPSLGGDSFDVADTDYMQRRRAEKDYMQEEESQLKFSRDELTAIAREVGKAVAKAAIEFGGEINSAKIKDIYTSALSPTTPQLFTVHVIYKNDNEESYRFDIRGDSVYLIDKSYDREIADVGVKPSGEAVVNKDIVKNEMLKYFKSLNEMLPHKNIKPGSPEDHENQAYGRLKDSEKESLKRMFAALEKEKANKVKEGLDAEFAPSPNSDVMDANAEEYDVATAFKKARVDMSKPVTVIHSYGHAQYAKNVKDEMSAEAAIKKLEAERQDRSKQYTDDGEEVPEDHHGYEFENYSTLEEEIPEGHEYKFAYFQTGDADYVITQEKANKVKEGKPMGFGTGQGRSKTISKGRETRPDLKAKLAADEPHKGKYVMHKGVPHKFKDGKLVPLKKVAENDRSWTKDDMTTYIDETIGGYLERYLGYNPGPPNHPIYKMTPEQFSAYIAQKMIGEIDELLDETDATIEVIRETLEESYDHYKKVAMGIGHDPDMHFEPEEEKIGADALGMVLKALDKMATPTKLETANPLGEADTSEIDVYGYQTKHFDICPGATKLFKDILAGEYTDGVPSVKEQVKLAGLAKLHDVLFKIEKEALKDSDKAKKHLQHAIKIASDIYELGAEIGLDKKHRGEDLYYIEDHLKKINDAARGELDEVRGTSYFLKTYIQPAIDELVADGDIDESEAVIELLEHIADSYGVEIQIRTIDEIVTEESDLDKVLKAMELVKQQAPAMNKLDRNDPKRIAFIEKVKKLNIKKKELMDKEDDRISNIGKGQELDVDEAAEKVDPKYDRFLTALRDSGEVNMFGAGVYLQYEFGLEKREAREILAKWMKSFGETYMEEDLDLYEAKKNEKKQA